MLLDMKINRRVIIAFLLIWLSVSLALVIPTVRIEANPILNMNSSVSQVPQPQGGSTGIMYVLEAMLWGIIAISVVGLFVYRKWILKDALFSLVSVVLGFLIVGAALFLGNRVNLTSPTSGMSGGGGAVAHPSPLEGSNIWAMILIAAVFGIIIAVLVRTYRVEKEVTAPHRSIKEYVEEAIYQVKIGKDVRGAILAAYLEMEKLMREHGVEDKKYYTPREFKEFAIQQLEISKAPVDALTALFEVARYSRHEMSEKDRAAALNALEEIKNEVEK